MYGSPKPVLQPGRHWRAGPGHSMPRRSRCRSSPSARTVAADRRRGRRDSRPARTTGRRGQGMMGVGKRQREALGPFNPSSLKKMNKKRALDAEEFIQTREGRVKRGTARTQALLSSLTARAVILSSQKKRHGSTQLEGWRVWAHESPVRGPWSRGPPRRGPGGHQWLGGLAPGPRAEAAARCRGGTLCTWHTPGAGLRSRTAIGKPASRVLWKNGREEANSNVASGFEKTNCMLCKGRCAKVCRSCVDGLHKQYLISKKKTLKKIVRLTPFIGGMLGVERRGKI